MSLEENKAIVRRFVEALNKKNLALLDDLIAPNYVDEKLQGRESAKQTMRMFYRGFPDLHVTIDDMIAEGDKVWARYETTGTPASGKKMEITSISIHRIVNGKIVEGWGGVIRKMSVPKVTGELYKKLL